MQQERLEIGLESLPGSRWDQQNKLTLLNPEQWKRQSGRCQSVPRRLNYTARLRLHCTITKQTSRRVEQPFCSQSRLIKKYMVIMVWPRWHVNKEMMQTIRHIQEKYAQKRSAQKKPLCHTRIFDKHRRKTRNASNWRRKHFFTDR